MPATRPSPGEIAEYYQKYVDLVPDGDVIRTLEAQGSETVAFLRQIPEDRGWVRYAEGKWSLREVIGHVIDSERVFASRALFLARGGPTDLPGFDQDAWIANAEYDDRTLSSLADELQSLRAANVAMLRGIDPGSWVRPGTADGKPVTPRAIAWILAGHELHHLGVVRDRYL